MRIPSPIPGLNKYDNNQSDLTIKSFTNSLLVNGTAIVPDYSKSSGVDQSLLGKYKDAVTAGYKKGTYRRSSANRGSPWKARFVGVDQLIYDGGAIHCVTMQVPAN